MEGEKMNKYELMLIVQGQIPEDLAKEVINKAKSLLLELGGKEENEDFWGRRKLAYKINGQEHGYYDVLNFQMEGENIKKLEKELKLINELIRYLIFRKEEKKERASKEKKSTIKKETVLKEKAEEIEKTLEKPAKEELAIEKPIKAEEIKTEIESETPAKESEEPEEKEEQPKEAEEERLKELDKKIDEILKE